MTQIRSFAPIADQRAEILILGSMPGRASLSAGRYYAHAQNAFWRIICVLLEIDPGAGYATRVAAMQASRIALWDVLRSCVREGSLDARIRSDSQIANDFGPFFRGHRKIRRVFFNGATAEACFRRLVLPQLGQCNLNYRRLPSTSPAHAALSFPDKLDAWRAILEPAAATRKP